MGRHRNRGQVDFPSRACLAAGSDLKLLHVSGIDRCQKLLFWHAVVTWSVLQALVECLQISAR